jgi:hypothetical protein
VLLLTPYYAPFLFGEHRYATTFQAAKALTRDLVPTKDLSTDKHRKRADGVVEVLETAELDSQTIKWAQNTLRARNDKSLPRRSTNSRNRQEPSAPRCWLQIPISPRRSLRLESGFPTVALRRRCHTIGGNVLNGKASVTEQPSARRDGRRPVNRGWIRARA